jgi:hypothetical protein
MTRPDHEALLDRMPEVAAGRAPWSEGEQAHLAGCASCREEWVLVQAAATIGGAVEREFDAAGAARAVGARWRERPAPVARPFRRLALAGLAAAAALALVLLPRGTSPAAVPLPFLNELDALSTEELALLADGLEPPLAELEIPEDAPLSDLDTIQLERVLRSLEG